MVGSLQVPRKTSIILITHLKLVARCQVYDGTYPLFKNSLVVSGILTLEFTSILPIFNHKRD